MLWPAALISLIILNRNVLSICTVVGRGRPVLSQLKLGISKVRHLLTEYRSAPRRPYNVALTICWRDNRGKVVHGVARCVDISDSGARIEYHQALAKLSPIRICANEGTL